MANNNFLYYRIRANIKDSHEIKEIKSFMNSAALLNPDMFESLKFPSEDLFVNISKVYPKRECISELTEQKYLKILQDLGIDTAAYISKPFEGT